MCSVQVSPHPPRVFLYYWNRMSLLQIFCMSVSLTCVRNTAAVCSGDAISRGEQCPECIDSSVADCTTVCSVTVIQQAFLTVSAGEWCRHRVEWWFHWFCARTSMLIVLSLSSESYWFDAINLTSYRSNYVSHCFLSVIEQLFVKCKFHTDSFTA